MYIEERTVHHDNIWKPVRGNNRPKQNKPFTNKFTSCNSLKPQVLSDYRSVQCVHCRTSFRANHRLKGLEMPKKYQQPALGFLDRVLNREDGSIASCLGLVVGGGGKEKQSLFQGSLIIIICLVWNQVCEIFGVGWDLFEYSIAMLHSKCLLVYIQSKDGWCINSA